MTGIISQEEMGEDISGGARHFNKGKRYKLSQKRGSKKYSASLEKYISAKRCSLSPQSLFPISLSEVK